MSGLQTTPAGRGKAVRLAKGQSVKVVNTHGNQVVDFWAFNAGDLREYLGMEHCRAFWTRLFPVAGDKMVTNRRRPILTMTEDHSPGRHHTLIAPCGNGRYGLLGDPHHHHSCRDNMHAWLADTVIILPSPPAVHTPLQDRPGPPTAGRGYGGRGRAVARPGSPACR